ncbi:MAG: hypothetical protein ACO1OT_12130 [Heyndrickxia sp.]
MNNHNLSDRENKIIEVLFLNLCAQANAQIIKSGMALNPIEKSEKDSIFKYQLAWQSSILPEQSKEFIEGIKVRIINSIKMCELPEVDINFLENSYLNK